MKATEASMRFDLRRRRAQSAAHLIMSIMGKYLPYEAYEDAYDELIGELHKYGAEIIGDMDREAAGLSPRGPDGWTLEEIAALERKRWETFLAPIRPVKIEG